jgi:magnesium chelatase family protein
MITRYQSKLSGPLLDRIDIHVRVPRVEYDKLMGNAQAESSDVIRGRVEKAKERQYQRFKSTPGLFANSDMRVGDIERFCILTLEAKQLLEISVKRMQFSARAYHRLLKLARTIADLAGSDKIETQQVAEAVQYRPAQMQLE